ncbi:hypothetical protein [Kordiimonas pumila]|uniref:DUF4178 domain-containing protein n=1 Tax=Kordiimonas pumila TaxID=2161677 RepID=A0ABV7D3K5_9PROT|nr:hypothetical protein [Kordiimonas pumila]
MSAILKMPTPASARAQFEAFRAELPLPVAKARQGVGGYVTLDFGNKRGKDTITGDVQYDWHLWVYMCDWDLYEDNTRLLWRRESNHSLAGSILEQLAGEQLTAIDMDSRDDCFVLRFTGGYSLNIDPDFYDFDASDDMFMLFRYGERHCLSFSPGRRFYPAA